MMLLQDEVREFQYGLVTVNDVIERLRSKYPRSFLTLQEQSKTRLLSSLDYVQNGRVYVVRRNPQGNRYFEFDWSSQESIL